MPLAPETRVPTGLLLLTGGRGRRLGGPKHDQPHPEGGTWGGHLVRVFQEALPGGPVQLLGQPLPDFPGLPLLEDAGQGPAAALEAWAAHPCASPLRWWVAACDQVRWTPKALQAWLEAATAADPLAERWVLARDGDHLQYLGSLLASRLLPTLAAAPARRLRDLLQVLPTQVLDWPGECWLDVDTPEEGQAWGGSLKDLP